MVGFVIWGAAAGTASCTAESPRPGVFEQTTPVVIETDRRFLCVSTARVFVREARRSHVYAIRKSLRVFAPVVCTPVRRTP